MHDLRQQFDRPVSTPAIVHHLHQRLVEFDHLKRQREHAGKVGITGSEIIQVESYSPFLQTLHHLLYFLKIICDGPLRNLDAQLVPG